MREWLQKLQQWLTAGKDRKIRILLGVGLAGILLIALSECVSEREAPDTPTTVTAAQVETALEERISKLLVTVDGVGRCRVMVTLENDTRAVYAADTTSSDTTSSERYLTVDTDTGPVGLLLTTVQPTVKGVVVVCDGAADDAVSRRVTRVVTTAFHISERRVCVVKQQ